MAVSYRITGDVATAVAKARKANARRKSGQGINPSFRHGTTRAALTVSATDRTLGASYRGGWRLDAYASETPDYQPGQASQVAHTAEWVANPQPLAYVTATKCDALGRESIVPKHNAVAVEWEWRLDHYNRGERKA